MKKRAKHNRNLKKKQKKIRKGKIKTNFYYIGIIFSIIAMMFLIINSLTGILMKEKILNSLINSSEYREVEREYGKGIYYEISSSITLLSVFWLLLTLLCFLSVFVISRYSKGWFYILLIGILSLFTFRIESGFFLLISSIFFWKHNKIVINKKLKKERRNK